MPYLTKNAVTQSQDYSFSDFGFKTKTLQKLNPGDYELVVYLPADFYSHENDQIELRLKFAYSAGLREDSTFDVFLNGLFEKSVLLNDSDGAYFNDYRIQIPVRSFQPGRNVIKFIPNMVAAVSGHCIFTNEESMIITLF